MSRIVPDVQPFKFFLIWIFPHFRFSGFRIFHMFRCCIAPFSYFSIYKHVQLLLIPSDCQYSQILDFSIFQFLRYVLFSKVLIVWCSDLLDVRLHHVFSELQMFIVKMFRPFRIYMLSDFIFARKDFQLFQYCMLLNKLRWLKCLILFRFPNILFSRFAFTFASYLKPTFQFTFTLACQFTFHCAYTLSFQLNLNRHVRC